MTAVTYTSGIRAWRRPIVPAVGWSDQRSFWQQGDPAVMVTDTAFYSDPHDHQAADRPEKLEYVRMARVVAGLAGALATLAESTNGGGNTA